LLFNGPLALMFFSMQGFGFLSDRQNGQDGDIGRDNGTRQAIAFLEN